jgi:serine protease inhibitor
MISAIVNEHIFENWIPYLSEEDYENLLFFIRNVKNDKVNDKILILSGNIGRNGKSTLIKEIQEYVGKEHFLDTLHLQNQHQMNPQDFLNTKLAYICGIDSWNQKKDILLLKKILNKQSIITDTNSLLKADPFIIENAIIIHMNHIF